jgi:hypothetical protein
MQNYLCCRPKGINNKERFAASAQSGFDQILNKKKLEKIF